MQEVGFSAGDAGVGDRQAQKTRLGGRVDGYCLDSSRYAVYAAPMIAGIAKIIANFASATIALVLDSFSFTDESILSVSTLLVLSNRLSKLSNFIPITSNFPSIRIMLSLRRVRTDSMESTLFSNRSNRSVMSSPPPPLPPSNGLCGVDEFCSIRFPSTGTEFSRLAKSKSS